jgi:hypothetical protein
VAAEPVLLEGDDLVRVVGVTHYQDALAELTGRKADEEIRADVIATLVPEPDNPHDEHAIAVDVEGRRVGYLSRDENQRWAGIAPVRCEARLSARGPGPIGVFLRLPTPTEARAQVGIHRRES